MDRRQFSADAQATHVPEADDPHPHACVDGFVYLGYTTTDPETGEETEYTERIPCRRCTEEREDRESGA
jgi:hypothetical protein